MSILRIALWAMIFHTSAMFCFIFLLYFDLRRPALLIVVDLCRPQHHACTLAILSIGQAFYGYGSMIAAAATFLLAFTILLRELPWLHYHAFHHQQFLTVRAPHARSDTTEVPVNGTGWKDLTCKER